MRGNDIEVHNHSHVCDSLVCLFGLAIEAEPKLAAEQKPDMQAQLTSRTVVSDTLSINTVGNTLSVSSAIYTLLVFIVLT